MKIRNVAQITDVHAQSAHSVVRSLAKDSRWKCVQRGRSRLHTGSQREPAGANSGFCDNLLMRTSQAPVKTNLTLAEGIHSTDPGTSYWTPPLKNFTPIPISTTSILNRPLLVQDRTKEKQAGGAGLVSTIKGGLVWEEWPRTPRTGGEKSDKGWSFCSW